MDASAVQRIEALLEQMIQQQEEKLFRLAHRFRSTATIDDLRQPHDCPELDENPVFQFEDGLTPRNLQPSRSNGNMKPSTFFSGAGLRPRQTSVNFRFT